MLRKSCIFVLLSFSVAFAVPKPEEKRVVDHEFKQHMEGEEHSKQYDHEQFLGEEAKSFDQLPPEESRRRLG